MTFQLTRLIVILVTPPNAAAAPITAYTAGLTQAPSAGQAEKSQAPVLALCNAATAIPTARPTQAPIVKEGRKIPAGMEAPKVAAVKKVRRVAVTRRRKTEESVLVGLQNR